MKSKRLKKLLPIFTAAAVCCGVGLTLLFKKSTEEEKYPYGYFAYVYEPPQIDLPELYKVSRAENFDCLEGLDKDRLEKAGFSMGEEDPAEYLITAKDALSMAQAGQVPDDLSEWQRRIVLLVAKMQETSLGREMTSNAALHDIWYCIDNNALGSASYLDIYGLLSIEMSDNSKSPMFRRDHSSKESFEKNAYDFVSSFYHELTHFYQHRIWKNADAPEGLCSMDKGFWRLCIETQAHLLQKQAAEEHRGVHTSQDKDSLYRAFVTDTENNFGHAIIYGLDEGKLDDGLRMDLDDYVIAFGFLPGAPENFLVGRFEDLDDLYDQCYSKHSYMHEHYKKAQDDLLKPEPIDFSELFKSVPSPLLPPPLPQSP